MNGALVDWLEWLNAPVSGSASHFFDLSVAWHGRLMIAAWFIVLPASIIVARFYKVTPSQVWPKVLDNPFWFLWHRRLSYLTMVLTVAALSVLLWGGKANWFNATHHAIAGWTLVLLGCVQIVNSLLRGTHGGPIDPFTRKPKPPKDWAGDHYCMTPRRIIFEYSHKIAGAIALPVMLAAGLSGLFLADAPRWMWIGLASMVAAFLAISVLLQWRGRCVDTYQAIWGTDPGLPGNRRKRPIGLGISRRNPD